MCIPAKIFNVSLACLLFLSGNLNGQSAVFLNYTVSDGLPDNTVTCIRQSEDGFIWIGTANGLSRFDGYNFKHYYAGKDKRKLSFSHIQDIETDDHGGLWIATRQGLNRLDLRADTLLQITQANFRSMPSEIGHDVLVDAAGRVWYASDNQDLARWLPEHRNFQTYGWKEWVRAQKISTKVYLNINRVLPKSENELWLCTNIGLFSLQVDEVVFTHYPVPEGIHHEFTDGFDDGRGHLWLNSGGGGMEVYNYRDQSWQWPTADLDFGPETDLYTQWSILAAGSGRIMAGLTGGLGIWDTERKSFQLETYRADRFWSLPDGAVLALFKDRENIIWVGTTKGLAKLDLSHQQFPVYSGPSSVRDKKISYVWESPGGKARYISLTGTAPLVRLDPESGRETILRLPGAADFYYLQEMIPDRRGRLWLMELNRISVLDLSTNEIREIPLPLAEDGEKRQFDFNDAVFDGDASIYFATDRAGLLRFDLQDEQCYPIRVQDKSAETQIMALHWDADERSLWFSSRNGWLGKYDTRDGQIVRYRHVDGDSTSLASEMVVGSTQMPDGTMCFISEPGGLSLLAPGTSEFRNFSVEDGLPVNLFSRILADDRGNLWLQHKSGLCRFHPRSGVVKDYGASYGIEFSTAAIRFGRTEDGHILLGADGGYLRFHPDSLYLNSFPPKPVLTSVQILDREYLPAARRNDFQLQTAYDRNSISISFALLNFTDGKRNRTRYRLLGADRDWQSGSGAETVRYLNLDPGDYRFEVAAFNSDGIRADLSRDLHIRVRPHFSQTLWFKLLLLVLFLGGVYAIYRARIAQVLKVQSIRNKIAADLHDDVASTISSIHLYSEFARNNTSEENQKVRNILEKIGGNARESLAMMREIVWAIRSDKDKLQHLREQMWEYAGPLCEAKGIQLIWKEELPERWKVSLLYRRNLYLIFKEAVNNAVHHADSTEIRIDLIQQKRQFRMVIADNGCGLDPAADYAGNGLKNMQLRAAEIKGELEILSRPMQGTAITLQVRLNRS
ncbi:sensor histidine kinase [Flavilitoribacter nigricans]|uniref:Histidine kinase domain-containing protein n=1 Tax=Flavilitoribacter nigricans (strain ATCC 23147 / DSM 23189 / NBRC 102662 / NCIMB 1420 / SS-2) TaxID=1122177 RepID=A0A2D0MZ95_FLAN2|nr:two-component regulator propeller domain-containing protein [Flavilitoribacter nigricans]PHN01612.1 hypothetical protein CRP01_36545 [Flavilitoribacter nigricans DSM 23189 = NBRC 102662]